MIAYATPPVLLPLLRAIRLHHWVKNLLIFLPVIMAHEIEKTALLAESFLAFISFSLLASAVYIINDIADVENDKVHRLKRFRPIAAGEISIPIALAFAAILISLSAIIALNVSSLFSITIFTYLLLTLLYSFWVKKILAVDIGALSLLYLARIMAGHAATGIRVSPWLSIFAVLLFASLALLKRFIELNDLTAEESSRLTGRAYRREHLWWVQASGIAFALSALMVFSGYVNSSHVRTLYSDPFYLWFITPALLFWIARVWLKAARKEVNEDPVLFSVSDPLSYLILMICILLLIGAV